MKKILIYTFLLSMFSFSVKAQWVVKHVNSYIWSGLNDIAVKDSIVLAGGDVLLRSGDTGEHWSEIALPVPGKVRKIQFVTNTKVVLLIQEDFNKKDVYLLISKDKGRSWQILNDLHSHQSDIHDFQFINEKIVYLTGYDNLYKSMDGGKNIQVIATKKKFFDHHYDARIFYQMHFINKNVGYVAAWIKGLTVDYLFISRNGGKSWNLTTQDYLPDLPYLTGYFYLPDSTYFLAACGDGVYRCPEVEGPFNKILEAPDQNLFHSTSITPSGIGYMVGGFESAYGDAYLMRAIMAKTKDHGQRWQIEIDTFGAPLDKVVFVNDTLGFTVSHYFQLIMKTTTGGGKIQGDYPQKIIDSLRTDTRFPSYAGQDIHIYPNPSSSVFTISGIDREVPYVLRDFATGQPLQQGRTRDKQIECHKKGLLFLQFDYHGHIYHRKLIVE